MKHETVNVFWFRRDLRLIDNAGLYHALNSDLKVLPIFIFDSDILDKLSNKSDPRVHFLHQSLTALNSDLQKSGSNIHCYSGKVLDVFEKLFEEYNIKEVYTNSDYEPYAIQRDKAVKDLLALKGIEFKSYKDQVIFEKDEIVKEDGSPYTVFTPYFRKWLSKLTEGISISDISKSKYFKSYPSEDCLDKFLKVNPVKIPTLKEIGFTESDYSFPPKTVSRNIIKDYDKTRDYPALHGTSRLGVHYRFGTISIREKARNALKLSMTYLKELVWREFYSQILWHFPYVASGSFRPQYDNIQWRNDESEFEAWCKGETGYPIVDAGMRELNTTGYMHNRIRMITASFLSKHLLIDWRWGEAYFADKLLDYDLASNNGGWQWAAGSGTDAAPYFRIFNPYTQQAKFDPKLEYIKRWVPEYGTPEYPKEIVAHSYARERCLKTYKAALSK